MGRVERLLGITEPIVLGAFGGLSSPSLTAFVTNAGGLGSYGLYGYTPERIRDTMTEVSTLTSGPIAWNLWLSTGDEVTDVDWAAVTEPLRGLFDEVGVAVPERPDTFLPSVDEQIDAVLAARPAVLSVVYGVPDAAVVDAAHAVGTRVLGTATTVAEAIALADGGVDAIIASGAEAAGHRVSFLAAPEDSLVGTIALVPQVVDAVDVPVIAAGGIADRRGVAAAFALGAGGVQVGTAFLRTNISAAPPAHRAAIDAIAQIGTVLTRAMSGRLARGVPNRAVTAIEARGSIAPFPVQNWLTGHFRRAAAARDEGELLSLWAGQAAPLARHDDAGAVFAELQAGVPR